VDCGFGAICESKGLKSILQITFSLGNLLLFSLVYLDNTWYLINCYVQSIGHYL